MSTPHFDFAGEARQSMAVRLLLTDLSRAQRSRLEGLHPTFRVLSQFLFEAI